MYLTGKKGNKRTINEKIKATTKSKKAVRDEKAERLISFRLGYNPFVR